MTEHAKASKEDVLATVGGASGGELSGPQRAAFKLAAATFILIGVCSVGMLAAALWEVPAAPQQPTAVTTEALDLHAKQIANYIAIRSACIDGAVKLFQTFIVAALLPVLMTTIGYIFGRGER